MLFRMFRRCQRLLQSGLVQRAAGTAHFSLPARFLYRNLPTFCIAVLPVFTSQRSLFHSAVHVQWLLGWKRSPLVFRMVAGLPGSFHWADPVVPWGRNQAPGRMWKFQTVSHCPGQCCWPWWLWTMACEFADVVSCGVMNESMARVTVVWAQISRVSSLERNSKL